MRTALLLLTLLAQEERKHYDPAVHEAKITAARHRRRGRGTYRIQLVEDIGGLARSLGKRLMKFGKSRESSRGWTYTSFSDIIDVANRFFSGKVQQLTDL